MNQKKTNKRPNRSPKAGRAKREYTAGGVVYRDTPTGIEILFIQDLLGRWTIPKGHVEQGEKVEETALREIQEETGLTEFRLGERLGTNHFFYRREGKLIFMTTYVYLVEAIGDTDALVVEDSEGIVDAKWFPQEQAVKLIAYRATEQLLKLGLEKLGVPMAEPAIINKKHHAHTRRISKTN